MSEVECPNCGAERLDDETMLCSACGLTSIVLTDEPPKIETLLPGFARNIQVLLFDLKDDEFRQIRGILSPRAGHGDEDGTAFDAESALLTQTYLAKQGIPCVRVHLTADRNTQVSLIVARTPAGLKTGVKAARLAASKARAVIRVLAPHD